MESNKWDKNFILYIYYFIFFIFLMARTDKKLEAQTLEPVLICVSGEGFGEWGDMIKEAEKR